MYASGNLIVLLGPPGAGKGTQAVRLSAMLGVPAISTGEMLRRECESGSALGKVVRGVLDSGQLVSDDLMNRVIASRLRECDCENGCILDGYPRTVSQARFLDRFLQQANLPRPIVLDFEVETEEVVARLSMRGRTDDKPHTIRERLRVYRRNASKLVRYYSGKQYYRIRAGGTPEEVAGALLRILSGQPALRPRIRVPSYSVQTA